MKSLYIPSPLRFCVSAFVALLILSSALPLIASAQTRHGEIQGVVSNLGTSKYLVGAEVEIPELNMKEVTGESGEFRFHSVPYGTYILVTRYSGLETERTSVTVESETPMQAPVQLTSDVYKLETYVVTGEREGNAAAITRQRQSVNLRTALSLDALGALPNDNIGELVATMPGVGASVSDEGVINTVSIRGSASQYNTLTVDGDTMQGGSTQERNADVSVLPASIFEEIEIIKAPLPEMRADAIGGNVNIKTTSLLTVGYRKRTNYSLGMRWAPVFYDPIPAQERRPVHPQVSFNHIHVFDVGGGKKNLALLVAGGYYENMVGTNRKIISYRVNPSRISDSERQLAGSDIPEEVGVFNYNQQDLISLSKKISANLKVEYRANPFLSFHVGLIYSDIDRPGHRYWSQTLTTTQQLKYDPVTGEENKILLSNGKYEYGHILPGSTNNVTKVEAHSENDLMSFSSLVSTFDRGRKFTAGGRYRRGAIDADFSLNWSIRRYLVGYSADYGRHGAGDVRFTVTGVGWTFDQTDRSRSPVVTPSISSPDWFDVTNYNALRYTKRDYREITDFYNARANIRIQLPTKFPILLKTGFAFNREERGRDRYKTKEYNYTGGGSFRKFLDLTARTTASVEAGRDYPYFDATLVADDLHENPSVWTESIYKNTMNLYLNTYNLTEDVMAGYLQGHIQVGAFRMIAGARYEYTKDDVFAHIQADGLSSAADRTADPLGTGIHDYNNPKRRTISYSKLYPSVHMIYKITPNFQARASWSNTIARPAPSYLYPTMVIRGPESSLNALGSITMNDPNIKPEYSMNWDAGFEYYFEPAGHLSVNYFYKDMDRFIYASRGGVVPSGPDNGFGGDYEGFNIYEAKNGGAATVQGVELSYRQELTFLPGILKGLGVYANYTWLKSEGDYDNDGRMDMARAGFIPRVANLGLIFKYRGFVISANARYADDYYRTASDNPAARIFMRSNIMINTNAKLTITRRFAIFINIANVTGEEIRTYQYNKNRPYQYIRVAPTIAMGVSGSF